MIPDAIFTGVTILALLALLAPFSHQSMSNDNVNVNEEEEKLRLFNMVLFIQNVLIPDAIFTGVTNLALLALLTLPSHH